MKLAFIVFILVCCATLHAQSNPVPLINQPLVRKGKEPNGLSKPTPSTQEKIVESYGKLPLSFEANEGQTDARVRFLSRGAGYTLFLTSDEAVFALRGNAAKDDASGVSRQLRTSSAVPTTNAVWRIKLVKANRAAKVTGTDQLPGKSNYFIGSDPKSWRSNVTNYAKVKYEGIYSGIDLVYYGNQQQLEYDFVVAPGADPRRIQLDVRGARKISLGEDGELLAQIKEEKVRWHKPVVYQEKDGTRNAIAARYVMKGKNKVGFEIADYDLRRPLFIDPLIYSTYLGGSSPDVGYGIAVDSSGNAYVTGITNSTNFPTMNPLQAANGSNGDAFVAKLNASGSALVYSTYLGGSSVDFGQGIVVDTSGNAYVTGQTSSTNFPTMNPLQPANGGNIDAFVAKLNPSGSALVYSTYLGGSLNDNGGGIAVDSSGNAYITGATGSADFPTMNPLQPTFGSGIGGEDAFVAKLNPTGTALVYSTYLGGSSDDVGTGIAVDSSGNAYVTGQTSSTNFPTMNPLQSANHGGGDAFVAQLNPSGSALVYSTYLGGTGAEFGSGIAVDSLGNAYITGATASIDFPTMNPLQPTYGGGNWDAFVAQLNPSGSALVYSTYLGGSSADLGFGIVVDGSGNAYVTGQTTSSNFPTMTPLQPANGGGGGDAFVAKLNPSGSALVYSTYLGGSGAEAEFGGGIAVDSSGNAYVTAATNSTNFPTMTPLQPANGGGYDAFVAKISTKPSPAVTLVPRHLNFGNQTVGIASPPKVSTLTNTGDGTLTIKSIGVTGANSGDFAEKNTCSTSVRPFASCNITVTFRPSSTGTRTAAVSITDNAPGSPQSVPLSGVGVLPAVTFSPTSVTFPTQVVFTGSKAKTVTLTNTGLGVLIVRSIAKTGPFAQTNTCGTPVKPSASCTISVTFKPTTIGTLTGSVSVTDNAPGSPQKVTLKGTGTYIQLTPTSVNFGNQPVGTKSLPKTITLTNKGSVAVSISGISITGTNASDFAQTHTCGTNVAAGASCFIKVTFKPSAKGKRTAQVSISDNGGGSPQKVTVTGTGT